MTMIYSGLPLNNNKNYRICWILNHVLRKDRCTKYRIEQGQCLWKMYRHNFPAGPRNWSSWECITIFYFLSITKEKQTGTSTNIKCINEKKKKLSFVTVIENNLDLGSFFILQLTVVMRVVHSPWKILYHKLHRGEGAPEPHTQNALAILMCESVLRQKAIEV